DRRLAVSFRHENNPLSKATRLGAAFDPAENVRVGEVMPWHQLDRLAGVRSFDVPHLAGEKHRAKREILAEFPGRAGMSRLVEIAQEPLAGKARVNADDLLPGGDILGVADRVEDEFVGTQ